MLKIHSFKKKPTAKPVKKTKKKEKPEEINLTLKQEMFAQTWVDLGGNGTRAALTVFDIKGKEAIENGPEKTKTGFITKKAKDEWKRECLRLENIGAAMGNETLRSPKVRQRIKELLSERGFNDDAVEREHFKIMAQNKDLSTKMRAISDYYKLKGRYEPEQVEIVAIRKIKETMSRLRKSHT